MSGMAELPYPGLSGVSENGRIIPCALSLPPTSYGAKNEDTTQKGGGVSDFYGELSVLLTTAQNSGILVVYIVNYVHRGFHPINIFSFNYTSYFRIALH